jgi:nucleotide-binding universal stress UspA family protein
MKVLISIDAGQSAEIVLQEAKFFLKGFPDAEVHVFTVIDMALVAVGHDTDETMMMNTLQRQANELVNIATRILGDKTFIFSTEVGYPVDEILEKAKSLPCDLLIMGTHGRTGFDHLLIGSVAEKVLRLSQCNTLIIPIKGKTDKK